MCILFLVEVYIQPIRIRRLLLVTRFVPNEHHLNILLVRSNTTRERERTSWDFLTLYWAQFAVGSHTFFSIHSTGSTSTYCFSSHARWVFSCFHLFLKWSIPFSHFLWDDIIIFIQNSNYADWSKYESRALMSSSCLKG